ncbi:hypothetical protein BBJ28_00020892 [Nothophytophthora sp. Chile5]|nr:hypothetical protein BBJ28_00020892 [Nothophytophthora sp. Chile5]
MTTSFAIAEVKALVRQPQRAQAQQLLERLATAVLPILTQRRFPVRRLLEFFPSNGSLLGMNVNRGAKIYIRRTWTLTGRLLLRPKRTPTSFLPYEALLETLLHELTHMVHGPHNQAFYQYLDELKAEMESLMVRGLVGEEGAKFAGAGGGQRLGGSSNGFSIRFPNDNSASVVAAKRRQQTSRRLGTANAPASTVTVVDPQMLRRKVSEAAERRRRDNANCGNAQIMGASHEILGIESSEEEGDAAVSNATAAGEAATRQERSTGTTVVNAIVLDDADLSGAPPSPHTSSSVIVDLIHDDEGQELNIDVSETELLTPREAITSSVEAAVGRDRKRKREDDAVEVIDLT